MHRKVSFILLFLLACLNMMAQPKIVNIVNFVRQNDYRVVGSEEKLYDATEKELALVREYGLPATFLLLYDALIDECYQRLFAKTGKERLFPVGHNRKGICVANAPGERYAQY